MNKPNKRVLMIGPVPPPFGGIASVMLDITGSDLSKEFEFVIFDRSEIPSGNGLFSKISVRLSRLIRFCRELSRGHYRFIHIHSPDLAFFGTCVYMFPARVAGVPVLVHMHGTEWESFYPQRTALARWLIRLGLQLPEHIIVLYDFWNEKIREINPRASIHTVANTIHEIPKRQESELSAKKQDLNLPEDVFKVLMVGSVGWRKGCFEILKAIPKVVAQNKNVVFIFVGCEERPGEMAQLMDLTRELGISQWIRFTGEVERSEINLFMQIADVFLLPSFIEGMPISIIEALQFGLPVISTKVGAIPEMMEHMSSGVLIDPGSPEQIADAVLLLMRDDKLRGCIGGKALEEFREKFEFSKGIEQIRKIYEEISA